MTSVSAAALPQTRDWKDLAQPWFLAVCTAIAWLPIRIPIGSLNVQLSQPLLPVILLFLWIERPRVRPDRTELVLVGSALLWWVLLLAFTLAAEVTGPKSKPLARVFLFGINLLHFTVSYWLVIRTRRSGAAVRTVLTSAAVMNAAIVALAGLTATGIHLPRSFVEEQEEPILVDGTVADAEVARFPVGVAAGCMSAAVFTIVLSRLLEAKGRGTRTLLVQGLLAGAGMIIGFSRQEFISLLVGAGIVLGGATLMGGNAWRVIRTGLIMIVLCVLAAVAVQLIPGADVFYQAFAARIALLFSPGAYTEGTVLGRTLLWVLMFDDFLRSPFVGAGQDAYLRYLPFDIEGSHNFPLEVLHASGIVGFLAYLIFHGTVAYVAWRAIRSEYRSGRQPHLLLGLLGAYVALALASTTNLIFWGPGYWMIAGLLGAAAKVTLAEGPNRAPTRP